MPGVAVDSAALEAAGLPATASAGAAAPRCAGDADRHRAGVAEVTDGDVHPRDGRVPRGRLSRARRRSRSQRDGSVGLAPTWRFATSPLAVMDLAVERLDDLRRQRLLARQAPGLAGRRRTPTLPPRCRCSSSRPGSTRSRSTPRSRRPRASRCSRTARSPTSPSRCRRTRRRSSSRSCRSGSRSSSRSCATQEVLQPTACPFGFVVEDRLASPPKWSIAEQPTVAVVPDGAGWTHPARGGGRAHRRRHPLALRRLGQPRERGRSRSSSPAPSRSSPTAARRSRWAARYARIPDGCRAALRPAQRSIRDPTPCPSAMMWSGGRVMSAKRDRSVAARRRPCPEYDAPGCGRTCGPASS